MKELKKPFAIILFIFLCIIASVKLIGQIPLSVISVQTNKNDLFQVQGTGKATEIPNSAKFSFGVTKTAAAVADAQSQTNTAVNSILNNITQAGIETKDITTINYSVFPQYGFDVTGKQIPNGYTVTQDIEIKISPIDKTSKILDIATANGANQIGGISFTFDDATKKKLEDQARQQAIQNAKEKAQNLAQAAGIHLGKIIDVKEDETNNQQPIPFTATAINSDKSQAITQLPSGENVITESVTLSYETF